MSLKDPTLHQHEKKSIALERIKQELNFEEKLYIGTSSLQLFGIQ
jgi:hypothetical protein